jgi:hypothetical protein
MAATYSINIGTVTETTFLDSLNTALNQLPNNTSHLVSPKDVRDAIYTAWINNIFKPTTVTGSSVEYIGVDGSQMGISLKEKMYFGKRRLNGIDIMSNTLLNNNSDIFFFNNKSDIGSQDTKISILGGASSSFYNTSPYLETTYIIGTSSNYLDFNIVNPTGDVNITSSTKRVSVNGLIFPTLAQSASASNGYVLKYLSNGGNIYLDWQPIETAFIDTVISSGTVSISGSPVLINGNKIEFTNSNPILRELGGVTKGMTFSDVPLVNLLSRILYPYIEPTVSIVLAASSSTPNSITGSNTKGLVCEVNSISSLRYTYDIKGNSYNVTSIPINPGGTLPPTPARLFGTSSISIPPSSQTYSLRVIDGVGTASATASLSYVYPYFFGVTTSNLNFGLVGSLSGLSKVVATKSDVNIKLTGSQSHIYFLSPSSYGDINYIIDESTGWNYISSFTKIHSSISLTSSSPYWAGSYNVYSYTAGGGITSVNSMWKFKH